MTNHRAVNKATEYLATILGQHTPQPPRSLKRELELEHYLAISRAKKRAVEHQAAYERATWTCTFCETVHTPKVVELHEGRRVVIPVEFCPCQAAQAEREQKAAAEHERRQVVHLAYLEGLDAWQKFDTEWPDAELARAQLREAKRMVWEWYADRKKTGLLLAGPYGCGKSHLLRAVVSAYGQQGAAVAFYSEPAILDSLLKNDDMAQHVFRRCKQAQILVLDDMGSREFNTTSQWAKHLLQSFYFQILERRSEDGFTTLFSTNYIFSDLPPIVGERAHDRMYSILKNRENIVGLWDVPSYRRRDF